MRDLVPKPSVELVRRALRAGADAGRVTVEAGHQATAKGVVDYVESVRSDGRSDDVRALVDRVVRAHVMLARGEGAAAGLVTTTPTTITAQAGVIVRRTSAS